MVDEEGRHPLLDRLRGDDDLPDVFREGTSNITSRMTSSITARSPRAPVPP
jgi:hypothetical protein